MQTENELELTGGRLFVVAPLALLADERLSLKAKMLWLYLTGMDFIGGRGSFPSNAKILAVIGGNREDFYKVREELVSLGVLELETRTRDNGSRTSNLYKIVLPEVFYASVPVATPCPNTDTPPVRKETPPLSEKGQALKEHKYKNNKDIISSSSPSRYGQEDKVITELLYDLMAQNNPALKRRPTEADYIELNRIHRIDGIPYEVIKAIVVWCQHDSFWRTNILSVSKLRKQIPQLYLKAQSDLTKRSIPSVQI